MPALGNFPPRAAGLNQALIGILTLAAGPRGALAIAMMPVSLVLQIDVATALVGIVPTFAPSPLLVEQHVGGAAEQVAIFASFGGRRDCRCTGDQC